MDAFCSPPDIGRIPHKIDAGFASFTADQWKNWTVYFSIIALRDIVTDNNLGCWSHFVLACRQLVCKTLSLEQLQLGDALLLQKTESLYGKDSITPNMHMHCYLRECIIDYGPLHGYWLYAFERYNGILGAMPNNNRSIEVQLMAKFLRESQVLSADFPEEFKDEFVPVFPKSYNMSGSVLGPNNYSEMDQKFWTSNSAKHQLEIPKFWTQK